MAHNVKLSVGTPIGVGNTDVVFEVRSDGELLGRLYVSKGGLAWSNKNAKKARSDATWKQFQEWMTGS